MKRISKQLAAMIFMLSLILSACETQDSETGGETEETNLGDETIVFGETGWSSTLVPTAIAKQILEEAGYQVESTNMDQPMIFSGMKNKDIDFFMDAWLPYTEAELWEEYKDDLTKVATSYENVPLGWVVPTYVEENSIPELKGKADKFGGAVVSIAPGAGIVEITEKVLQDETYALDDWKLNTSSETAMMSEAKRRIENQEPIVITGWKPHSMFAQYDLKFLEDPQEYFKYDNVYVLSYKGIEETHPAAYDILSKWKIEVADLEELMLENEQNGTSYEELAEKWIQNNRKQVDEMLGKYK